MKLKEGMYVRTEYGISKIVNIFFEKTGTFIETDNGLGDCTMSTRGKLHKGIYIFEEDYKTFIDTNVKNTIIDLIEVGDVITFQEDEDVYRVLQIPSKEWGFKNFYLVKNYDGETEDIFVEYNEMKKYINSIVTKEQFESVQYKVERG